MGGTEIYRELPELETMIFFPAIDLKNGQCVRLLKGDMNQATIFGDDPSAQAKTFENAGCQWIHVVDLNGAVAGKPVNGKAIDCILKNISIPIELGGGIRDRATMDMWLEKGVRRVILGTASLKDPSLVREACQAYPDRIAVSVDARDGKVAVNGWAETSEITGVDLAKRFEDTGVAVIIYTDIDRDGIMKGPNFEATMNLASTISIPVIASGGVSSMDDLQDFKIMGDGLLAGVISGRAVYDGCIDPGEAAALLGGWS